MRNAVYGSLLTFLSLLALAPTAIADTFEDDDTLSTAKLLPRDNSEQLRWFDSASDHDYFCVVLPPSASSVVTVTAIKTTDPVKRWSATPHVAGNFGTEVTFGQASDPDHAFSLTNATSEPVVHRFRIKSAFGPSANFFGFMTRYTASATGGGEIATDCQGAPSAGPFEPNNSRDVATPITASSDWQTHFIDVNGDIDWVSFSAPNGNAPIVSLDTASGAPVPAHLWESMLWVQRVNPATQLTEVVQVGDPVQFGNGAGTLRGIASEPSGQSSSFWVRTQSISGTATPGYRIRLQWQTNQVDYAPESACNQTPSTPPTSLPASPGLWSNPDRNGTAWALTVVDSVSSEPPLYATWFTYDAQRRPVWLDTRLAPISSGTNRIWWSPLLRRTWSGNSTSGSTNPAVPVGEVSIRFLSNDPTRAAIRWQLYGAGIANQEECIVDYFRHGLRSANAAFTGPWIEGTLEGYGLQVSIAPLNNLYTEILTLSAYDTAGLPVWVQGVRGNLASAPPLATSETVNLEYHRSTYNPAPQFGGLPITSCPLASCGPARSAAGTLIRTYNSAATAAATINATATVDTGSVIQSINWRRPPSGTGTVTLTKLAAVSQVVVDRTACTLGSNPCTVNIDWSSVSNQTQARVYRDGPGGPWRVPVDNANGTYRDTLSVAGIYRYLLKQTDSPSAPDLARSADVAVSAGGGGPLPTDPGEQPVQSLSSELPPHDAGAGALAGTANTDGGAASYDIPIAVPPGRAGKQPALALSYSSTAGNGVAGVGFSLSGLSSIQRCPQTLEQDGQSIPVSLDATDRLCLDGQRLVRVGGAAYGLLNAEYRTEIDSFARITQFGGSLTGNVSCFKVEAKNGDVMWYGGAGPTCATSRGSRAYSTQTNGTPATRPLSWLMEIREDRLGASGSPGNNIIYSYQSFGAAEVLVTSIAYTGFGGVIGNRRVDFLYEPRPERDRSLSYLAGTKTAQTQRLQEIRTVAPVNSEPGATVQLVRSYSLIYGTESASSGKSLLRSVMECGHPEDGSAPACRPATSFTWQEGRLVNQFKPLSVNGLVPYSRGWDFDGDGITELMALGPNNTTFLVAFNADRTERTRVDITEVADVTTPNFFSIHKAADFDLDGKADLYSVPRMNNAGEVKIHFWDGPSNATTLSSAFTRTWFTGINLAASDGVAHVGDMDGDTRADVVVQRIASSCTSATLQIYLNRGPLGPTAPTFQLSAQISMRISNQCVTGGLNVRDIDGDGISDLIVGEENAVGVHFGQRNAGVYSLRRIDWNQLFNGAPDSHETDGRATRIWMDVNGDGLDDYLTAARGSGSGEWRIRMNTGATSGPILGPRVSLNSNVGIERCHRGFDGTCGDIYQPWRANLFDVADTNGDGREELLFAARFASRVCRFIPESPGPKPPEMTTKEWEEARRIDEERARLWLAPRHPTSPIPTVTSEVAQFHAEATKIDRYYCPEDPNLANPFPNNWALGRLGLDEDGDGLEPHELGIQSQVARYPMYEQGMSAFDASSYVMHALRINDSPTGLRIEETFDTQNPIVGLPQAVMDLYGDGLTDRLTTARTVCTLTTCAFASHPEPYTTWTAANVDLFSTQPNNVPHLFPGTLINEGRGPSAALNPDGLTPQLPDLLCSVNNGLGLQTDWTYYPLSSRAGRSTTELPLYTVPVGTARYTDERHFYFTSSMPVVATMRTNARLYWYGYQEAMYNHQGRGLQGFRAISVEDRTFGVFNRTRTVFHQKFPLTSQVESREISAINSSTGALLGVPFSREQRTWRCHHSGLAGAVMRNATCPQGTLPTQNVSWMPFLDSGTEESFDLDSAIAGTSMKTASVSKINAASESATASGYDAFGNLRNELSITRDEPIAGQATRLLEQRKSSTRSYTVDTATWWLDRLDSEESTQSVSYAAAHAPPAGVSTAPQTLMTTFAYSTDGRRLQTRRNVQPNIANQSSSSETLAFSTFGLPTSTRITGAGLAQPRTSTMLYSTDGYYPSQTTNALGHIEQTTLRPRDGQTRLAIDAQGRQMFRSFDAFGQMVEERSLGTDGITPLSPAQRVAVERCPSGCDGQTLARIKVVRVQDGKPTTQTLFDSLGREVFARSRLPDGAWTQKVSRYNPAGHANQVSNTHREGDVALFNQLSFDRIGRLNYKLEHQGGGLPTRQMYYIYTGRQLRVRSQPLAATTPVTTPCAQSPSDCFDIFRRTDALGRILEMQDQENGLTRYWFDGAGNPTAIQGLDGHVTRGEYNSLGQRTSLSDPNMGTWTFTYSALGELLIQTDARGVQTSQSYDVLGRTTLRRSSNVDLGSDYGPARTVTDVYTFDATAPGLPHRNERRIDAASNGTGGTLIFSEQYDYDAHRRLSRTHSTREGEAGTWTDELTYHSHYGWVRAHRYPSGYTVHTRNTKYGHAFQVGDGTRDAQNNPIWSYQVQSRDANGDPIDERFGNGIKQLSSFTSASGQLLTRTLQSGIGTELDRWSYHYQDSLGNLTRVDRNFGGTSVFEQFAYDKRQRLISATRSNATPVTYQYAANGNIQSKSDYGFNYQYGSKPHAVTQVTKNGSEIDSFSYDANGNLVGGNTLAAVYDHDNLPWSVTRINGGMDRFAYAPDGQRFRHRESDGVETFYGQGGYEKNYRAGAVEHRHHLPGMIVNITGASAATGIKVVTYRHTDRLGSTVALSNATGTITERRSFDAFGKARNGDFTDRIGGRLDLDPPQNRGFTDHEHLDNTRLIHMNGRSYDYQLGRFLAVDPFIQFPANSQSLNPYSYLMNNPMSGTDPSGYCAAPTGSRIKAVSPGGPCPTTSSGIRSHSHLLGFANRNATSQQSNGANAPSAAGTSREEEGSRSGGLAGLGGSRGSYYRTTGEHRPISPGWLETRYAEIQREGLLQRFVAAPMAAAYGQTFAAWQAKFTYEGVGKNPFTGQLISGVDAWNERFLSGSSLFVGGLLAMGPSAVMRVSGARTLKPYDFDGAEAAYDSIRATDDVASIASNTGFFRGHIERIKNHLFFSDHRLDDRVGRFDADPLIANAWQRLQVGTHTGDDLKLLRHELFESKYEGIFNQSYRDSHNAANRAGRPSGLE